MTASDTPWEPPLAGSEVQQLIGALNRLRTTFRWKADDLDAIGLQTRIVSRAAVQDLLDRISHAPSVTFVKKVRRSAVTSSGTSRAA